MHIWTGIAMSVLGFGLFAGCGGGEDGEGSVDGGLARQGNAACAKVNRRASAELLKAYNSEPIRTAASAREAIRLETRMLLPIFIRSAGSLASAFRALAPTAEDSRQIASIVSAYDDWSEEANKAPREVVLRNDIFNEARRLAARYGLARCAQSPFEVNREG
jgi:hypothetical protein